MSLFHNILKQKQTLPGLILIGLLVIPFGLHFAALWDMTGAVYSLLGGLGLLMALVIKIG